MGGGQTYGQLPNFNITASSTRRMTATIGPREETHESNDRTGTVIPLARRTVKALFDGCQTSAMIGGTYYDRSF